MYVSVSVSVSVSSVSVSVMCDVSVSVYSQRIIREIKLISDNPPIKKYLSEDYPRNKVNLGSFSHKKIYECKFE